MAEPERWPNSMSLAFVEGLYAEYQRDPTSVPEDWRSYFDRIATRSDTQRVARGPSFRPPSVFNPHASGDGNGKLIRATTEAASLQDRVDQLIRNFRVRGHAVAKIDPLGRPRPPRRELEPDFYGFTEADMDKTVSCGSISGQERLTLREVIRRMQDTYCQSIGPQFMHIDNHSMREWLQSRMEGTTNRLTMPRQEQLRILRRLTDAGTFEQFIQTKYIGAKSFSIEGAESLVPLLDLAIEKAGSQGVKEIVLGMAHRGRLNVLANILGKSPQEIFREFEDVDPHRLTGRGDVKYHLGYSHDRTCENGARVHLSLCFNPSHLEFVNPVAVGRMRAKQDRIVNRDRSKGLVLLVHGDAGFSGEGVVQETLNLSHLDSYSVGGTLHVIMNNQIGFTTGPEQGRSSPYATDVAKMLHCPIFHVNGEDPEAVAQVIQLSMDFRQRFKRDVVIDMYCYRKHGHNEGDEPSFTQPLLYKHIRQRKSVREHYLERLLQLGGVTREEADRIAEQRRAHLERDLAVARSDEYVHPQEKASAIWQRYVGGPDGEVEEPDTGADASTLSHVLLTAARPPEDFHPHRKILRGLKQREKVAQGEASVDWATAEMMAFGSLAMEGARVRLSGQDSERGTFSQRHAVLHDAEDGHTYMPLASLSSDQAPVEIINSPLSELGVLGFEYGYSLDYPDGLVCWEAQFGDFINAGQVIVDQFIASAEDKWRRLSGLVLLLPHAFEGQGPEHSSARLERFLELAAEDNIQIINPTTPAQYFHALRRQVHRRWRKPLVVMTPKGLLRHPKCVSGWEAFTAGRFQRVIPDTTVDQPERTRRVLLCSGKIYYELVARREESGRDDVAIVRVEQLYPFPEAPLKEALAPFAAGTPVVWVQEEPANMGAWGFLRQRACETLFERFPFGGVTRPDSASPATGSHASHQLEQEQVLQEAFNKQIA